EDVSVDSHAASRLFTSAGGAATSVDARAGAFAITVDRGVSRAYIARSDIMADGRVAVDAQTDTEIQTWGASASAGASSGVAGSAVVSIVQTTTQAFTQAAQIGTEAQRVGNFSVNAADRVTVKNRAGAIGVSSVGMGGVAAVTLVGNTTAAYVDGGSAFVQGAAAIEADSERYLSTLAASGGLGGATLSVNVAVILAGSHLAGDVLDELDAEGSGTLTQLTAFATSDRLVTDGENQTIQ